MQSSDQYEPVSPIEASPVDYTSAPATSVEHQQQPRHDRWSMSTATTAADIDKAKWEPPPLPPIPPDREQEAWRRRSLKRCSYTSQMSKYSATQPTAAELRAGQPTNSSTLSLGHSMRSAAPTQRLSQPTTRRRIQDPYEDLHWQVAAYNPRNWSNAKKWLQSLAAGM